MLIKVYKLLSQGHNLPLRSGVYARFILSIQTVHIAYCIMPRIGRI